MLDASPSNPNLILPSRSYLNSLNHSASSLVLLWGWSIHGAISSRRHNQRPSASLHSVGVDAGRRPWVVHAHACLVSTLVVDVLDVEGVDVTWEVAQDRQQNIDAEVYATSSDEGHADGRH